MATGTSKEPAQIYHGDLSVGQPPFLSHGWRSYPEAYANPAGLPIDVFNGLGAKGIHHAAEVHGITVTQADGTQADLRDCLDKGWGSSTGCMNSWPSMWHGRGVKS